ncbi:hypothetical protein BDR03DRAFT_1093958 [Suillus americanus]|nr:hypothetical protein BDR03DRAFT_1093958 [Suillus americanus]
MHFKVLSAGDISNVEVLGQHTIVLNSVKTVMDMLDNKSTVCSDRPVLPMVGEFAGWKDALPPLLAVHRSRCLRVAKVPEWLPGAGFKRLAPEPK